MLFPAFVTLLVACAAHRIYENAARSRRTTSVGSVVAKDDSASEVALENTSGRSASPEFWSAPARLNNGQAESFHFNNADDERGELTQVISAESRLGVQDGIFERCGSDFPCDKKLVAVPIAGRIDVPDYGPKLDTVSMKCECLPQSSVETGGKSLRKCTFTRDDENLTMFMVNEEIDRYTSQFTMELPEDDDRQTLHDFFQVGKDDEVSTTGNTLRCEHFATVVERAQKNDTWLWVQLKFAGKYHTDTGDVSDSWEFAMAATPVPQP
eukprot:TRINITY_DN14359_c0_g2_i1.p1 TRINITY_DN14359_c0_g2~~TRINITY_DN14359_c0_g2_i1.p1  ORF type:complete len:268 (+),score=21.48 TRINITY_DN14359_c0_g2_i1:71-874(+)